MPDDAFPIKRAMVVHAHPDDAEFNCAGTIARMAAEGVEWTLVVCTNGNAGGEGDRTHEELAKVREAEQRAAADIIGVSRIVNLGYDDGNLQPSLELRRDITRVIRLHQPNLVITANPVRHFGPIQGNHPDHLAAGEACLAAIYPTARNPMAFPELLGEGLEKWVVDWVYVTGTQEQPNHYVDITGTLDKKIAALRAHASQLGDWVGDYVKSHDRGTAERASDEGLGDFQYAEAFVRMFTGELNSKEALEAARDFGFGQGVVRRREEAPAP